MKVNEAIYRSPKWLRNIMDFEVSTGEDIKGSPSKRRAKIIEEERKKKAEEDRLRAEKQRKREEEENQELFKMYFNTVMDYIRQSYKDCYILISAINNIIIIEKDDLIYDYNRLPFSFMVRMDNRYTMPKFEVNIKVGNKNFSYNVSGINYIEFKLFIIKYVVPFCNSGRAKKRPINDGNYNRQQKEKASTRTNKGTVNDPTENRKRRINLLKDVLEGYER